jgi:hypothetical protein
MTSDIERHKFLALLGDNARLTVGGARPAGPAGAANLRMGICFDSDPGGLRADAEALVIEAPDVIGIYGIWTTRSARPGSAARVRKSLSTVAPPWARAISPTSSLTA